MMRKTVPVTVAGAAIALALVGAGSAQADPQPIPSPPPPTPQYPVPSWVTEDAQFKTIWGATRQIIDSARRDPVHANENARRILEGLSP